MSFTRQPSSSQSAEKAPAERLTPLARRDLEIANLERQVRDLRQQNDELWSENEDFKAKGTSWVTLLEDLKAREEDLKAKEELIKGLSTDIARQELEIKSYKEHNLKLQELFHKHHEELLAAGERHKSELAIAQYATDTDPGPLPLRTPGMTKTKEQAEPAQPQQSSSDPLVTQPDHWFLEQFRTGKKTTDTGERGSGDAQVAAMPALPNSDSTSVDKLDVLKDYEERFGVKVDVPKMAEDFRRREELIKRQAKSSEPGEDQVQDVDGFSMSRGGPSKMATLGNKPLQPDKKSTTTKRSFSHSFNEPGSSQKKPKLNRSEVSPPTTPAGVDVEAIRTAPREKELEQGKPDWGATWETDTWGE